MDFDTRVSEILVIFQLNVIFQHTYDRLNEKFVQIFFVKSHELKFSIVIEMV
jgi:hypothetical protein